MKKTAIKALLRGVISTIIFSILSCSKSENPEPFIFIPQINGTYNADPPNDDSQFSFLVADPGANSSTFTGHETLLSAGRVFQFKGSYTGHNIELMYVKDNPPERKNKRYAGTINDSSTVIQLHGIDSLPLPSITLRKMQ